MHLLFVHETSINIIMETIRLTKRNRSTLQELAGLALEHLPMTVSTSDRSPGRKAFFPIPLKKNPNDMSDFIYVYVESKLNRGPQDKTIGFTQNDVVDETGVYLFKKNNEITEGQTFPLELLLTDVIDNDSLRNRIVFRVGEMRQMVHLDDDFLISANASWDDRVSDEDFGFKRLH